MIRPIMKNTFFLSGKSEPAVPADAAVAMDLIDTLRAHRAGCVGMAANMIGVRKRIIIVSVGPVDMVMFNPVITAKKNPYMTKEGCLSLTGEREVRRWQNITVTWQDMQMKPRKADFSGYQAQIIQHECDHLEGIII